MAPAGAHLSEQSESTKEILTRKRFRFLSTSGKNLRIIAVLSSFSVRRSFDSGFAFTQDDAFREGLQEVAKLKFARVGMEMFSLPGGYILPYLDKGGGYWYD